MLQITSLTQSQAVSSVLDLCCGSGVQGIVALRYYAQSASFVAGGAQWLGMVDLVWLGSGSFNSNESPWMQAG